MKLKELIRRKLRDFINHDPGEVVENTALDPTAKVGDWRIIENIYECRKGYDRYRLERYSEHGWGYEAGMNDLTKINEHMQNVISEEAADGGWSHDKVVEVVRINAEDTGKPRTVKS